MKNSPVGIIDSGIGGLSVWREVVKLLPNESIIYLADSKHAPYGPLDREEIIKLSTTLIEFLLIQNVKLIIIACNTITVSGIDLLRQKYPQVPIIGTVPVIKTAAMLSQNKRIGVFATSRTATSQYQMDLINKFAQDCDVVSVGTDKLVPLIEEGLVSGRQVHEVLTEVLQPLKEKKIDTLAVACTHYPFIEKEIRNVLGDKVNLLEPSAAVARHAKHVLELSRMLNNKNEVKYKFFTSGRKEKLQKILKLFLNLKDNTYVINEVKL